MLHIKLCTGAKFAARTSPQSRVPLSSWLGHRVPQLRGCLPASPTLRHPVSHGVVGHKSLEQGYALQHKVAAQICVTTICAAANARLYLCGCGLRCHLTLPSTWFQTNSANYLSVLLDDIALLRSRLCKHLAKSTCLSIGLAGPSSWQAANN